MPHIKRHGVSRKITNPEERETLRKVLTALNPPKDIGIIVRTAAADRKRREIHRDLNYLLRLWMGIQKRAKKASDVPATAAHVAPGPTWVAVEPKRPAT